MKLKLQTMLKHKLQWLVLLTALLGVSQGVWGDDYYLRGNIPDVGWDNNTAMTNSSGTYTYSVNITTSNTYQFKLFKSTTQWLGKDDTSISETTTIDDFFFANSGDKGANINLNANVAGNYIFSFNVSAKTLTVTYPTPCTPPTAGTAYVQDGSGNWGSSLDIYGSSTVNLKVTGYDVGSSIQWQYSTDNSSWNDCAGETSSTASISGVNSTTYYRAQITNDGCSATTSAVTVTRKYRIRVKKEGILDTYAYIYIYDSSCYAGDWPGTQMTSLDDTWWYEDLACSPEKIIFNNGVSGNVNQTVDITDRTYDCYELTTQVSCSCGDNEKWNCRSIQCCTTPTATQYPMSNATVNFDGSPHAPTITPADGAGTVATVYYAGTSGSGKTNAGTYAITVDVNAGSTYCAATGISLGNFVINKIDQVSLSISNSTTTYCENESVTLETTGGSGDGSVTYSIVTGGSGGTGSGSIDGSTLTCSSAGTIVVKATKAADTNYNSATSENKTFTFNSVPSAGTISGSSSVCSGVSGAVSLTLNDYTSSGTTAQWQSSSSSGGTYSDISGKTGSSLSTSQTAVTYYKAKVTNNTTGCYSTSAYKEVGITPNASIASVGLSVSSMCIGQGGVSATPNTVVLGGGTGAWSSTEESVATVSDGSITALAAGSTNITYTITGGCGGTVSAYETLTVKPNAAAAQYTIEDDYNEDYTGSAQTPDITIADGAGDISNYYYSSDNGSTWTAGTPTNAGVYKIKVDVAEGTSYCAASGIVITNTFTINKIDQPTAVTIDNETTSYCVSTLGTDIPLEASGGDGTGAYSFTITGGTVAADKRSISGSTLTVSGAGTVILQATRAADTNYNAKNSGTVTFTFTANGPKVFTLTNEGATALCGKGDGSSTGIGGSLRLTGSETGYSYQLKKDDANYGDPVAGTGSALTFPVTASGVYTCTAYYGVDPSQCPTEMNVEDGGIVLVVNITPRLLPGTPTVRQYQAVTITSTNTEIDKWVLSGEGADAYTYDSTPNSITLKANTAGSPYRLIATTSAGCTATAVITVIADTENCPAP